MRKARGLLLLVLGGWLGWRVRESLSSLGSSAAVNRRSTVAGPTAGSAETIDKARAIVELGRERGRDLLRQALRGGHAA